MVKITKRSVEAAAKTGKVNCPGFTGERFVQ